jgi:hypothetical protein
MLLHIFLVHKEKPVGELRVSQIVNPVNACDKTLPLHVTKNVPQYDFRFSTVQKECDAGTSSTLLLSDVRNNVIIARCFHPRYLT